MSNGNYEPMWGSAGLVPEDAVLGIALCLVVAGRIRLSPQIGASEEDIEDYMALVAALTQELRSGEFHQRYGLSIEPVLRFLRHTLSIPYPNDAP